MKLNETNSLNQYLKNWDKNVSILTNQDTRVQTNKQNRSYHSICTWWTHNLIVEKKKQYSKVLENQESTLTDVKSHSYRIMKGHHHWIMFMKDVDAIIIQSAHVNDMISFHNSGKNSNPVATQE